MNNKIDQATQDKTTPKHIVCAIGKESKVRYEFIDKIYRISKPRSDHHNCM